MNRLKRKMKMKSFTYAWRDFPWGKLTRFTIKAENQEIADQKAYEHMGILIDQRRTVMSQFYRIDDHDSKDASFADEAMYYIVWFLKILLFLLIIKLIFLIS